MKIGVIGFFQLRTMQYLTKYTDVLDDCGVEYDVIHWNREDDDIPPSFKGGHIVFNLKMVTEQPFYKKIVGFLRYGHFMRKTIRQNRYDKLIILTTQTAIPLFDFLLGKYRGKYVYGFYDMTKESKSKVYKKLVKKLLNSAAFVTMSSFGFLPLLGLRKSERIIQAHNTQSPCADSGYQCLLSKKEPVRITYWGIVRQLEFNKKLCDAFGNDKRYCISFHGNGYYMELQEYAEEKDYGNIHFTGRYERRDIPEFVESTDILNCLYENDDEMKPAMQVKFYDAVKYRKPMLVHAGSYAADYGGEASGILSVEFSSNITNEVYEWYMSLQADRVWEDYRRYEKQIYTDDCKFKDMIANFVAGG